MIERAEWREREREREYWIEIQDLRASITNLCVFSRRLTSSLKRPVFCVLTE